MKNLAAQAMAQLSNEAQRKGLTKKQYSDMMSCRRKYEFGYRWNKEKKECELKESLKKVAEAGEITK